MVQATLTDLREMVLANQSFGPSDIDRINKLLSDDPTQFAILRDAVNELASGENQSPATMTRLGVCQTLVGKFREAQDSLKHGDGGALAQYYLGKVAFQLGDNEQALQYYDAAEKSGYTPELCRLATAEVKRYIGDKEEAMRILDNIFGPVEQSAEYLYQRGATVAAVGEIRTKFSPSISEPYRTSLATKVPCLDWRSRMIESATINKPSISISEPPTSSPLISARLLISV